MPPVTYIVLPTYNESANIVRLIPALFELNVAELHVLVVDDNSPDGTGKIVETLAEQVDYAGRLHVLRRPQKQGLAPAYVQGFSLALSRGADYVIQMDADLSHQPKYIPGLLRQVQDYDIVIGSRYAAGGSVDDSWGPLRKLLSWWANRVYAPTILRIPIRDATGGFRIYRRDALLGMDMRRVKANGYVFMVEMIYVAHQLGYRIGEIPIHFPDRQYGDSKMSSAIALEAALRVWQIRLRHRQLRPTDRRAAAEPAAD